MDRYDHGFYDDLRNTALPSARRIVPMLRDLMKIDSVVDVGCGDGSWLSVFRDTGAKKVLGLDGDWIDESLLNIARDDFRRVRLDEPMEVADTFDLAMSLEVAEHLPPERAPGFVAELCGMGSVVLFSAAIPRQGGVNHLNEQWPAYWANLFNSNGHQTIDVLRMAIWDDPEVTWWYKQNLLLFANEDALAANPRLAAARADSPALPLALVHPDKFMMMAREARPSFSRWLRKAPHAIRASLTKHANK
ncbi:MAG: class I SAM-dependent methyltransferase [Alphaproteobacteria bacterium]|nr:class I SAM-dependent methyltransferase [Alphaproteobacteria bacterium]